MARALNLLASVLAVLLPAVIALASDPPPLYTRRPWSGIFEAGSIRTDGFGFAPSDNLPRPLDREAPANRLSLIVLPEEKAVYRGHRAFTVLLVNTTSEEVGFEAVDSKLPIVREARDARGRWREIEFRPWGSCLNSYHTVFLPAGHYWTFAAPVYSGTFVTTMRFVLAFENGERLYSNAFMGFMDPGQFDPPSLPR